jgi:transcriptional regulator with XRE-family HTH domain
MLALEGLNAGLLINRQHTEPRGACRYSAQPAPFQRKLFFPLKNKKDKIFSDMSSSSRSLREDPKSLLGRFGARLRETRVRHGLSAAELSALAEISRPTLRNLENGHDGVAVGALVRVLGVLGLSGILDANPDTDAVGPSIDPNAPTRRRRARKQISPIHGNLTPGAGRPRSIAEVEMCGRDFGKVDMFLREFLDEFYLEQDPIKKNLMLLSEPLMGENPRQNAYLAAVAEHLAMRNQLSVPPWVNGSGRFLRNPFFPGGLDSLKALCILESPSAFRRRMIFVDADPLSRPRRNDGSSGTFTS